jgi:hypothetical protein
LFENTQRCDVTRIYELFLYTRIFAHSIFCFPSNFFSLPSLCFFTLDLSSRVGFCIKITDENKEFFWDLRFSEILCNVDWKVSRFVVCTKLLSRLRNIPEESRSNLHRSWILKSPNTSVLAHKIWIIFWQILSNTNILELLKLFSWTNTHFIENIKCQNLQLKHLCIRSYMCRSIWTILREPMLILAKVTLLLNYQ